MNRWLLFLGFTAVLCLLVAGELFLNPPEITRFAPKSAQNTSTPLLSEFPKDIFAKSGLSNVSISDQGEVQNFFNEVPIHPETSKIRVLKTVFIQKNGETESPFFVLYEFFSTQENTVINAYTEIENTLKAALQNNPEGDLGGKNAYGDMSFYENIGKDQKTVYLVVAFGDKIYGFEYPKEIHVEMIKLYKALFPRP